MEKESMIEKASGSLAAGIAGTTVAVLGSSITPLAAFVPFLLQSLASRRQSERLEKALIEINETLKIHGDAIQNLSDPKYKFINEAISSVFQTVDEEKIEFLKNAIDNAITSTEITEKNTDYLSRVIRDISVSEAKFLIDNAQNKDISFGENESTDENRVIKNASENEVIVSGLINMGLLYSKKTYYDAVKFEFSPIVAKLILLLKKKTETGV